MTAMWNSKMEDGNKYLECEKKTDAQFAYIMIYDISLA